MEFEQVLDPDFYVSTLEQFPGIFMGLIRGPPDDDVSCTSNCDAVDTPKQPKFHEFWVPEN